MESTGLGPALSRVLDAAEESSPVEAVEAVTRELGASLGATAVSFLIADLSGRALVRLGRGGTAVAFSGTSHRTNKDRQDATDSARALPFDGGPAEQALRTQTVQVLPPAGASPVEGSPASQWTVLAPVTERGEVIGLLEMLLPTEPGPAVQA